MSDQAEKPERPKRDKKKFDYEKNTRTIFVGNLPASYDHRDVAKLFKSCGPVESARIRSVVPDKEKLAPKVAMITKRIHPKIDSVNAYVVFEHNDDDLPLKKALSINGKLIDKHHIRVDRAVVPNAKRMTITSRKKSIFVGNLRFDVRDDDLINHFKKIGPVNYVRIVRDRSTGLGKGFGFVVFEERSSVKKALELDDTDFKGRNIRIKKIDEDEKKKSSEKSSDKEGVHKPGTHKKYGPKVNKPETHYNNKPKTNLKKNRLTSDEFIAKKNWSSKSQDNRTKFARNTFCGKKNPNKVDLNNSKKLRKNEM